MTIFHTALHLPGFRIRFDDADDEEQDIAYVRFFATKNGTPNTFGKNIPYPSPGLPTERTTDVSSCNIRACLANPSGDGGLLHMSDRLDSSTSPPSPFHLNRARKLILPAMHEHGPLWRPSFNPLHDDKVDVEYPWHAWTSGVKDYGADKQHLWISFDFPCSSMSKEELRRTEESSACIIC